MDRTRDWRLHDHPAAPGAACPGHGASPWTQGTIRRILQNEVYLGKLIWGRVSYERQPGTNKMVRRAQPRAQWKVTEAPELRIVSDRLWQQVRARETEIRAGLKGGNLARGRLAGHQSKYLFSGFLRCGSCGGAIGVVSSGKAAGPRYGCIRACRQYNCDNRIETKVERIEQRLLDRLQAELLKPEITDYIIRETTRRARQEPSGTQEAGDIDRGDRARAQKAPEPRHGAGGRGSPRRPSCRPFVQREESIRTLEGELALALVPIRSTRPRAGEDSSRARQSGRSAPRVC